MLSSRLFKDKKGQASPVQRGWNYIRNNPINMLLICSILIHFFKWGLNFNNSITWYIDVMFALIVLFVFFNRGNRTASVWQSVIIVTLLEILLPSLLGWNESLARNKYMRLYLLNRILTPWWFYYGIAISGNFPDTFISRWSRRIVIFFWIGVLISVPAVGFSELKSTYVGPEQMQAAAELWDRSVDFYKTGFTRMWDGLKKIPDAYRRQMDIATGGYYTGRVDENQNEPLGVYLENVKPSDTEFYRDELASVWGTLRVKTLDDGIKVKINCYSGEKDDDGNFDSDQQTEKVFPKEIPRIYDLEHEDIDCSFEGSSLKEGSNKITVQARFNFETMAYLKTYFMDQDRIRSMLSQDLDPLGEYGIKDKDPVAIYTNGPGRIGIGFSEPPIGISDNYQNQPRLGITVESNIGWEGMIAELKELIIQIPDTMSIVENTCNHAFKPIEDDDFSRCTSGYVYFRSKQFLSCMKEYGLEDSDVDDDGNIATSSKKNLQDKLDSCLKDQCKLEYEGYNTYYLDTSFDSKSLQNIEDFKTFNCRVNLDNPQGIMGNVPVSTQYIRAKARYDYVIEEETHVNIKKDTTTDTERLAPRSTATSSEKLSYVFNEYYEIVKRWTDEYSSFNGISLNGLTPGLIMAQITVESSGDKNAVGTSGEKGLLQIMPATAEEIREDLGIAPGGYNLFEPEDNIRFGVYYLAKMMSMFNEKYNQTNLGLASYNAGYKNIKDACCKEGVCIPWSTCAGSGRLPPLTQSLTPDYINRIHAYKDLFTELQLETVGIIKSEKNTENTIQKGSIELSDVSTAYDQSKNTYLTDIKSTKLKIEVKEKERNKSYYVDLHFGRQGNEMFSNLELVQQSGTANAGTEPSWMWDKRFPFIRFRITGTTIEYEYMQASIVNVGKLEIGDESVEGVPTKTDVWKGWVKVWIDPNIQLLGDDKIILYDSQDRQFCTVNWPRYVSYGTCNEIPGIIIRNIETNKKEVLYEGIHTLLERGDAIIQVEYDPEYSAPCCTREGKDNCNCPSSSDCATCTDEQCNVGTRNTGSQYGFICTALPQST
ncbi:transglycosylase SLT domain-containing protein [Candidatus Woesearchaeota archaeon]|nr:transglycosylase SLT domain-containing protein [Candidatus Woesearchaeota archaeon]